MKTFKKKRWILTSVFILSAFCYYYLNVQSGDSQLFSFFNAELFNNAASVEERISFPEIEIVKVIAEKFLSLLTASLQS
ncbi:MAG TPA: hypothetical protein PKC30_05530 [Saprospiraceae bacterium]|nr:hypothetical protein [Saprospiraceae bacterium]